jgi:hypothetical protein
MHQGNEAADHRAKKGAKEAREMRVSLVAAGEEDYILVNKHTGEVAEGRYRSWVGKQLSSPVFDLEEDEEQIPDPTRGMTSPQKIQRITRAACPKATAGLLKRLGRPGMPTWRFWSRLTLQILPVNARLMKFANSSDANIYKHVYGEDLGPKGRCARCGCEEETVKHAIMDCCESAPRWEALHKELMELWGEYELEWGNYDWVTNEKPQWNRMWSALGLTPKGIETRLDINNPAIAKLIGSTSMMVLQTAEKVWKDRNTANEEAETANEDLRARKVRANRTKWRWVAAAGALSRKRSRLQQATHDQGELKKQQTEEARESARGQVAEYTEDCTANRRALPHPRLIATMAKEAEEEEKQAQTMRTQRKEAAERVSKARKAGNTRDIRPSEMTASMCDSLPSLTTSKRSCYWIPEVGTSVEAFWLEHGGPEALGTMEGRWYRGVVTSWTWSETQGSPGAVITYGKANGFQAGYEDWAQVGLFGRLVRPVRKPRKAHHKPHDTVFPECAVGWMGIGTRLRVRHSGSRWLNATVLGTEGGNQW